MGGNPPGVSEGENLGLSYSHFADWGQAGVGFTGNLGNQSSTFMTANAEYKLSGAGKMAEVYLTGFAYGALSESNEGFSVGLRAKMRKGYNLYASAGRRYFSSGGNETSFNLSLAKSFGANAERIFRRH
ncbi:hypothetical protein [Pseudophaeobacter sp.]|uniref:hypothetical protein n=1 Tax=Pseudophaeobacter sp. TaxID=1971739 RepID=UPI0032973D42